MKGRAVTASVLHATWAVLLTVASVGHAAAQTRPPDSTDEAPTLDLRFDGANTFTWNEIVGATGYTIQGNAFVARVNAANPICSPPLVAEDRNVNITGSFGAETTSYRLELPAVPTEDRWFVASYSVSLLAFGNVDGNQEVIARTLVGGVAESTCAAPPVPTPLLAPITVGTCEIPAGFVEVTTPAAVERRQRVFESGDHVTRIYVRADGSCVTLNGAVAPVPEFAPEGDLGVPDPASDRSTTISLPDTGDPSASASALIRIATAGGALGCACLFGGLLFHRPRARS